MTLSGWLRSHWDGDSSGPIWSLLLFFLAPFSWIYSAAMRLRAILYFSGIMKRYRLDKPVISIGNLTVGGTGKTPVTAFVAKHLLKKGLRVTVLSRGYGGRLEGKCAVVSDGGQPLLGPDACGDEPYMLATSLSGLSVVIGRDRYAAGLLAIEQTFPDIFILDDGFQHIRLHRDLNVLLMDYNKPLGNGMVLPAGPLREPVSAAKRADILIYTRAPLSSRSPDMADWHQPFCCAAYSISGFRRLDTGELEDIETIRAGRVVAVTGIAGPDSFFEAVAGLGVALLSTLSLPDHEPYGSQTIERVMSLAVHHSAEFIAVTAKDAVKLQKLSGTGLPTLLVAELELDFSDPEPLNMMLDNLLSNISGLRHNF